MVGGNGEDAGRKLKMNKDKLILFASLALLLACAPAQPPPPKVEVPLNTPIVSRRAASGCEQAHQRIYLPGVYIDAYPSLPPAADPDYLILHLSDGTTIWGKPEYGSVDCTDYLNCRRATLFLNPAWKQCQPQGISYDVATADGRLVLESSLWEITDSKSKASAYVGLVCGQGFAGSSLSVIPNQTPRNGCSSQPAASVPTGTAVAAAMALGAAYFNYRAAYDRPVLCVTDDLRAAARSAKCY